MSTFNRNGLPLHVAFNIHSFTFHSFISFALSFVLSDGVIGVDKQAAAEWFLLEHSNTVFTCWLKCAVNAFFTLAISFLSSRASVRKMSWPCAPRSVSRVATCISLSLVFFFLCNHVKIILLQPCLPAPADFAGVFFRIYKLSRWL